MRSEQEIKKLILHVAGTDERIRAVLLNGSRANPNIKKDGFQDFDVIYIVKELNTFLNDYGWIDIFGERLILQTPVEMAAGESKSKSPSFSFLMLFKDRNRIDLTLFPLDKFDKEFKHESPIILWLDKDNLFSNLPTSNNTSYLIERPTEKMFADCCNEFWWLCTYVAKGLWRQEITYAKDMLENPLRKMFLKLIEWYIGVETGFGTSFGKSGKNMQASLPPLLYKKILSTYPNADCKNIWESLFIMCNIFSELANKISRDLGIEYNSKEEYNVKEYLNWVYSLTKEK